MKLSTQSSGLRKLTCFTVALLSLFTTLDTNAQDSCNAALTIPSTVNGISVTGSSTGSVSTFSGASNSPCSATIIQSGFRLFLGNAGAFTYTVTFSQAVNNIVITLGSTGTTANENFIFTTNTGTPSIATQTACFTTVTGNQIVSGLGSTTANGGGGGIFTISNTTPFTTMTVSGSGGALGSLMGICAESVTLPLPVTLVSFTTTIESGTTKLHWVTSELASVEKFNIERSADSKTWHSIGMVSAKEASDVLIKYDFTDFAPLPGDNFYRLKMTDKDATVSYSPVRLVTLKDTRNTLTLYPNPVYDRFYLKDATGNNVNAQNIKSISITNSNGKVVYRSANITNTGISVRSFSNGMYIVKTTLKDGSSTTHKMVVIK